MTTARDVLILEPSEPLPDVLRKICASSAQVVVMDVSAHTELRRRPDLVRVLRLAAAEAGKDLRLVPAEDRSAVAAARARPGRRTAERRAAPAGAKGLSHRRPGPAERLALPKAESPRSSTVFLVFTVLAGALLAAVAVFVLPRARVTIETAVEPLVADLTISLSAAATEAAAPDAVMPARHVVAEEEVEGTFPVETIVQRGERAAGTAWLVNRTSSPQGIKGGTRLLAASGVVVRTQADALLPAGGRAAARVRADAGGSTGNLSPQRLTLPALPAASQRVLYAEIVEPLTGGTEREVREVGTADIERAAEALRTQSEARLMERVRKEFGEGEWFDRPQLRRVVLRDPVSDVPVGAEAEQIRVRALVRGEALAVDADALRRLLAEQTAARAGGDRELLSDLPLGDARVVDVRWDELRAELSLRAETSVTFALPVREIRERLAGRAAEDAERYLGALPGVVSARVTLSPVWIRSVPAPPRNVSVTFVPERRTK